MKKLFVLIGLVGLIAISSCKKPPLPRPEDTENNNGTGNNQDQPSAYVGTWDYTKIVMTNGTLGLQGQSFGTFVGTGKDIVGSVVVTENPNRFTAELEYTAALTLTIFNQEQERDMPVEKRTITGDWTESNGQISLNADDGSNITIVSSTSNKVVFKGTFEETIALGQQFSLDAVSDVEITIEK
ncbi:MAG: hypothetical protein JXR19_06730 [Bacteroidia bacterium]